ncbi:LD-carboxypeptidase [Agromyces archimandritae]|uniref:LD-carboxypeptidase n=1 Tax=Agromyces archimandritae TaxID=2781962 RepID=A0A975IQ62_9MICO|nr:LD-carboxypeptidase [Agromyces archimandritae]
MSRALGPLAAGARVALVAPSGPPPAAELARAVSLVSAWGLEPVVFESARSAHPRARYLAAPDAVRAADLETAWCDPAIDAVFCVRGGYGAVRILDRLDAGRLRAARPKPLYGSSDVTAVHEYWAETLGVPSWFTPMLATRALLDDDAAIDGLRRAVFEPVAGRSFARDGAVALVPGRARGILVGGNLSLLAMTLGARRRPPAATGPRIGLLEDVAEEPYRLDGLLVSLLRAGWFDGMTGIALGSWQGCGPTDDVRELVEELLVPLGVPLVWELGFGHGPGASSIPLGVVATLDAGERPSLRID